MEPSLPRVISCEQSSTTSRGLPFALLVFTFCSNDLGLLKNDVVNVRATAQGIAVNDCVDSEILVDALCEDVVV